MALDPFWHEKSHEKAIISRHQDSVSRKRGGIWSGRPEERLLEKEASHSLAILAAQSPSASMDGCRLSWGRAASGGNSSDSDPMMDVVIGRDMQE